MNYFEDKAKKQKFDAAMLLDQTFRKFETIKGGVPSPYISPSGLTCPMDCAFKLQGVPTEDVQESFQSKQFAVNGEDRHNRIQEFLQTTPYWVDVAEYVKRRKTCHWMSFHSKEMKSC